MAYLILHMAKVKASEEEFKLIYQSSGLNTQDPRYMKAMFDVVYPHIQELRDLLSKDNGKDIAKFNDMGWRLSMVTSCRSRQKIMVPKYTCKIDFQTAQSAQEDLKNNLSSHQDIESVIFDSDYDNMKRLQTELQDALKSVNSRYSKKVFKFLK